MKITVLGSSHGNPTVHGFQTSVLLEEEGAFYLVDAGDGAATLLIRQNIDPSALSAIFISHFHLDHTASLPVLLHLGMKHRSWYPEITPEIFLPEYERHTLFQEYYSSLHHFTGQIPVHFRDMRRETFEDERIKVRFIPTAHVAPGPSGEARSFAIWVQTREKKILFTGDLKGDFSDFPQEEAAKSDILFCELTHYPPEKALEKFRSLPLEKLVFYHLHDPYQTPEGKEKVLQMCREFPFEVCLSFDSFSLSV